jgi:urease accessory protein
MAVDAALVMAEGVIFGRTAMDEEMRQGRLFDRWRVRREGQLVFADTTQLGGDIAGQLAHPAVARGAIAIATVFIAPGGETQVAAVRERDYAGEVGISTWNGIALARLVATNGEALRHDLRQILLAVGGALPRLWLN